MPWCATCDRFLSPNTVHADGTCPTCGRPVDRAATTTRRPAGEDDAPAAGAPPDEEDVGAPWHFWLLIVSVVAYLLWRVLEAVGWLAGRL